ncbi:hemolysin family protein [Odoribacter sp. OttesenSCG-928-J03]|nr:hemolysin family protein [Odoribacter sp. OttesenSCG-928-J03]MDL2330683.1 hemolysin family protein [Odoribacter sp. OttesenSCG-928-A06]
MSAITVIIICLLLSAFFSGMEIAFIASNKLRIEIDRNNKSITQRLIDIFVENSGMYITTILVGNNVVMVIYGIFMTQYFASFEFFSTISSIGMRLFIETLLSTLIILVFAEFLPKTLFRLRPNLLLKIFSIPVFIFYLLFFPISSFAVWLGGLLLRLFTGKKLNEEEQDKAFSKIDLNNLVEEGEVLGKDQEEIHEIKLFRNALDFSEVKIRECIVPRPDLIAISIESSLEELTNLFVSTGKSRILIYKETIDNIIGYVHSSSLFQNPTSITQAISKVIIVPETMSALNLLNTFTKEQRSMAVVVNEFGITAGIVTLEDVMEEIFGEIEDEHDLENPTEITVSENEYIFSGRLSVDYLNEKYPLSLQENEEYETLAGYILYFNESIPSEGEKIEVHGILFEILRVKNARIEEIKVII